MAGLTKVDNELLVWDPSKAAIQGKLGDLVQYFQVGIPLNADGIPKMYIDPTQIMPHLLDIDTPDDLAESVVEEAKTAIDFEDGFPTVEGVPFWERLEGEPMPYYKLFKEYREMKFVGEANSRGYISRSIAKLSESSSIPGKHLNALSHIYHWQLRVKAFDKYKEMQCALDKQRNIEMLENKHAKVSNELLDQAVDYLLQHPEQLSPKTAIDLVQLSIRAGRLAVGLNPDKPGVSSGASGGTHVSIVNQNANVGEGGSSTQGQMELSDIEKKTEENSKDVGHLQSILHVLNASGAFKSAVGQAEDTRKVDPDDEYVDTDYKVE